MTMMMSKMQGGLELSEECASILSSLRLSPSDFPAVREIADKLRTDQPSSVDTFGQNASGESVISLTEKLLQEVRTGDLDNAGEKLNEVLKLARATNQGPLSGRRSKVPLFGRLIDKCKLKLFNAASKYQDVKGQIDSLMSEVGKTQSELLKRNEVMDDILADVKREYHSLGLHIAAGKIRMMEINAQYEVLKPNSVTDIWKAQELNDLSYMLSKLDKRTVDFAALQQDALHTLATVRMVQMNNQQLMDKYHTIRTLSITAWQRQLVVRQSLNDQENAVELADLIDDFNNELHLDNAKLLKTVTTRTAISNQRLVIDVATLDGVQVLMGQTATELLRIHKQGDVKLREAEKALSVLHDNLLRMFANKDPRDMKSTGEVA
ncbi:TelA-like protein [compost metagenome]